MEKTKVIIYTDGSCLGNPGPGGWAAKLMANGQSKTICGGFANTTNNRMELWATIMSLEALKKPCNVTLYTDSKYVGDAISKGWLKSWQKNGWKKADKKPVLNVDLWQKLSKLLALHSVTVNWVKAHAGDTFNEEVDTIARECASQANLPADLWFEENIKNA